jgi:DNA-binding NarL/FixJ family response regulator
VTRVLLVDDDPALRQLLRLLLQRDPRLEVVGEAGDGAAGLAAIADLDPDVVLLDLAMPGRNGFEVLAELDGRARPAVAVVTGFDDPALREQALAAGAVAFLVKGRGFAELVETVAGLRAATG